MITDAIAPCPLCGGIRTPGPACGALFCPTCALRDRWSGPTLQTTVSVPVTDDLLLDALMDWADDHFLEGDFEAVDAWLGSLDPTTLPTVVTVAVLTITLAAHDRLPSRAAFVRRCRGHFAAAEPHRIDALLRGLEVRL